MWTMHLLHPKFVPSSSKRICHWLSGRKRRPVWCLPPLDLSHTELAALQARRDKTQAVKRAMMQALLTGRIRLVANPALTSKGNPR